MSTVKPDLAYLVHEADNELLRHSLRSVERHADGQFRKIWIVGVTPSWVTGVEHIPVEHAGEKFADIRAKLTALVADRRVAANVVVMNDDHIATGPVESWEPTHMGSTADFIAEQSRPRNTWWEAMRLTAEWMGGRGHGDILCYAGHIPLMYSKSKLKALLAEYPDQRLLDVGLYPEAGSGGEGRLALNSKIGPDRDEFLAKINNPRMPGWVSTNDKGWAEGMIGGYIRGMYPHPSRFES